MKRFITLISIFFLLFGADLFAEKRYGLIIGSNYKGNKAGINELGLCEADATYMESQIKKVGNFEEITVLLGKDVTKTNIESAIKSIGKKASSDDVVFIFFAGHGFYQRDAAAKNGMRNYIVCYDRPHLSDEELHEYLKSIKTQKTVFALDCCYSGGITKKGKKARGNQDIPIPEGASGTVKQGGDDFFFEDKVIISSADDNQLAIEVGGTINHGIFTYHFGRAMENGDLNGDKTITALEAFFKTREEVIKTARQHDHEQEPQISGNASGILLSGKTKPEPPKVNPTPNPNPLPSLPEPEYTPPKPNPVKPVVTPVEPPANPVSKGDLLIKTTIIKDRSFGNNAKTAEEIMKNRNKKGDRKVKVLIDDAETAFQLIPVKTSYWGASMGKSGEVYHILVKGVGMGVHKVTIKADDYPEVNTTFAVTDNQENILEMTNCMSGFGLVEGQVFYKTLDNPVINHKVYFPTINSVVGSRDAKTDKNGKFWFTTLVPGEYEIIASRAENLELNNSKIVVKEGEVTKVQVILNVKLPGMKTKY
jgi:uncharacterized caspase-like protein